MNTILALALAVQTVETSPSPSLQAEQAVESFSQICLSNRTNGAQAVVRAIRALPDVIEQAPLPLGNKSLQVFKASGLRYAVRPEKRGFGCFVAFNGDSAQANATVAAVAVIKGLTPRPPKAKGKPSFEWSVDGSKDHVRLVPRSDFGGVLINLETTGE